jgi:methionyl-tRNA formyltransferase
MRRSVIRGEQTVKTVVFAYHNVGVRCLKVLLANGVEVALVVTHEDNRAETIWFESVAAMCDELGIPFMRPAEPTAAELRERIKAIAPDFIFSFYYRHMLPIELLDFAKRGAYNMHGSLLPKYRGRSPVNWAVLHGESETGATLHEMTAKPDAGSIVAQTAIPILPDDTAHEVFDKLSAAAEQTLGNALPAILDGTVVTTPNVLEIGSYYGARKPDDGRIDWSQPAQAVYNLHRAVAPPYPGAFTEVAGIRYVIVEARMDDARHWHLPPGLAIDGNRILGICGDGRALRIAALLANGEPVSADELRKRLLLP